MTPKVPISETGTATLGMKVVRTFSQEHEDHQDDQDDGEEQGPLDIVHGGADGCGLIHGARCRLMDCGNGGVKLRQHGADAIHGVDDVGAGLPEDDDQDGGLAVGVTGVAQVFDGIDRLRRRRRGGRRRRCDRRRSGACNRSALNNWSLAPTSHMLVPVGEVSFGHVGVGACRGRCGPAPGRCRICSARRD